jgi:hypothetical protein
VSTHMSIDFVGANRSNFTVLHMLFFDVAHW